MVRIMELEGKMEEQGSSSDGNETRRSIGGLIIR
jgi:hypothetical protein